MRAPLIAVLMSLWLCPVWAADERFAYYVQTNRMIQDLTTEFSKSQVSSSVDMHVDHFAGHGAFVTSFTNQQHIDMVDEYAEAGAAQVDLLASPLAWIDDDATSLARYDALVTAIRAGTMKVRFNWGVVLNQTSIDNLADWTTASVNATETIANRYCSSQADCSITVVHETSLQESIMGFSATSAEWATFATTVTAAIKAINPLIKVGAGGLFVEEDDFNALAGVAGLDFMTLDIYTLGDFAANERLVNVARAAGKWVEVEETWRPHFIYASQSGLSPFVTSLLSIGDPYFAPLDSAWMVMMKRWAQHVGVRAITPVWSQCFFSYYMPETSAFQAYFFYVLQPTNAAAGVTSDTMATFARLAAEP